MGPRDGTTGTRGSPLREVAAVMTKIGIIGFGGPAAHIALMRDEMVSKRHWLPEREFLDLLGSASALPGPTSTQLSMLLSKRRAGWRGLLVGGCCFITPAMLIVLAVAVAYVHWGTTVAGSGLLYGIKPVVIAIVATALLGLLRVAVQGRTLLAMGTVIALLLYLSNGNALAALFGVAAALMLVDNVRRITTGTVSVAPVLLLAAHVRAPRPPRLVAVFLEFLKLGTIVFGSGYVLLAFLRRDLVVDAHWISTRQLLDAASVGQFTPGPVFTTATFVGYLVGGLPGALLATLGIFLPSFALMTAIAPVVPRLRRSPWSASALDGLNAAAVGLMGGVTIDLGRAALVDGITVAIALGAFALLLTRRANSFVLIAIGGLIGLAHALA